MNTNDLNVTKRMTGLFISLVMMLSLTSCGSTDYPRDNDETGKLTEATVYDVSQTPRIPLADAWVVVEYWYVSGSGIVEAKDNCRASYSLKTDAMGKVQFPERTNHTVKINAYKPGFGYKTARIKPPYEVSLQPMNLTRKEEFLHMGAAAARTRCWEKENQLRGLERQRYFYLKAKALVDTNDAEEMRRLWWITQAIEETEALNVK